MIRFSLRTLIVVMLLGGPALAFILSSSLLGVYLAVVLWLALVVYASVNASHGVP